MILDNQGPETFYRERFRSILMAEQPTSVLDLGCGDGALVSRLIADGVDATGLEPDTLLYQTLVDKSMPAKQGTAEKLPFEDGSFDFIVSEFSVHHMLNAGKAMVECQRVARRGLIFLDQWYDITVPHQRTARHFERWTKAIDERCGQIHRASLTTGDYWTLLKALPHDLTCQVETVLVPKIMPPEHFFDLARDQLARIAPDQTIDQEWAAIQQDIARDGISDEGAVIVTAKWCD